MPPDAVLRGIQGLYAYVVGPDDAAQVRLLKVGPITADTAVIEDGLKAGDRVVTAGAYRLQPGMRVMIAASGADLAGPGTGLRP